MSEATIRFLLADDHVLVRKGIIKILEEAFPSSVFGEASDAAQAIAHVLREKWDIALLDLSMPGRSGFDLINDLKQIAPSLPLLVLTMYPAEQVALRAYKAGAAGYLTKESVASELETAIRKILSGKKYIPPLIADLLADEMGRKNDTTEAIDLLSDREYEVFLKIAQGKRLTDIAEDLSLSIKTISTYRSNILQKLKLRENSDLTSYALQRNLLL
jgi:DNA-binding NarL/FixJ family response regulator